MKRIGKIKRISVLCLIFLLSINSFATSISNNDGSAFITKAEFDALKSSFQAQIDMYNQNIDSKIDTAVAAYLAGIRVSREVTRPKLVNTSEWGFLHSSDYPQYAEGKPYLHGHTFDGVSAIQDTTRNCTWVCIDYKGNEDYLENGGFKKNFVDKIQQGKFNGVTRYVAEYSGYWINEGENIALGGATCDGATTSWAAVGEKHVSFNASIAFSNKSVPSDVYTNMRLWNNYETDAVSYYSNISIPVQAASRISGTKALGNNVSIYNDISDDRFYDINVVNKIGITNTTPAILKEYKIGNVGSSQPGNTWWPDVLPDVHAVYASVRLTGGTDKDYFTTLSVNDIWEYDCDFCAFTTSATTTRTLSLPKLANDPNGLQFKYLWSPYTAGAAAAVKQIYDDAATSIAMKDSIKKALIYDKNNVEHLSLGAGYPFIKVEKDEEVTWEVSVPSTYSYDVDIIAKYSPFNPSLTSADDIKNEADLKFTNGTASNKKIFEVKKSPVSPADNTIKFKAEKDGIIFLKWAQHGFGAGAQLDVSKEPMVKLVEE